jgi:hypothetical protein
MRFSWAEITGGLGLAVALCLFEDHYSLHLRIGWPNLFIKLPWLQRWHRDPHECMESWGISIHRQDAHLNWGRRSKIIHFPWAWEWYRTSHLLADGTWLDEIGRRRRQSAPNFMTQVGKRKWSGYYAVHDDMLWRETYPYRYVLRSGEVQERQATVTVTEMEHRWRWFTWLPFPRRVGRSIDVKFSAEVGEGTGSWKGGTVGCGFTIYHDETPRECLNRMEHERKFDR